jgi:hypothetical protein
VRNEPHPSEIANLLKDMDKSNFNEAIQTIPNKLVAYVTLELLR